MTAMATIPPWLQRATVPSEVANLQKSLAGLQESFAAEGSTIPIPYGPFQIGGKVFVIVYNSGTSTYTVGLLVGLGPIASIDHVWINAAAPVAGVTVTNHLGSLGQAADTVIATAAGAGYTDTLVIPVGDGISTAVPVSYVSVQFTTTHYPAWPTFVIEGRGRVGKDPSNPSAPDAYLNYPTMYLYDFITRVMEEPIDGLSAQQALLANKAFVGTTGFQRRTGGVIVDSAQQPQDWVDILRMYAGCFAFKRGATWVLAPDAVRPVDRQLTTKDFVKETFVPYLADSSIVPTVVRIVHTFDGPDPLWIEETAVSIDPDVNLGLKPRLESFVRMPGIQNFREAQWEAQERRRKLGLGLTFVGVVADDNCVIEPGDVVQITHWRLDQPYKFRITEAKMVGRGRKRISGTQYDPAVYDVITGTDYSASLGDSGVVGVIVVPGGGDTINITNTYVEGGDAAYNPNFELGNVGWAFDGGGWSIQATNVHQGSFCLKATGNMGGSGSRNTTYYPCRPGDRFVVAGYIKTDGSFAGTAYCRVDFYAADRTTNVNQQTTVDVVSAPNTAYTEVRGAVIAPAGVQFARLLCVVNQTAGNCYFDDCQLIPQTGAKVGEDLISFAGGVLNGVDIQNDSLVTSALGGALNANPTFEIPRLNPGSTHSPASWWRWNSGNYPLYDDPLTQDVVRLLAGDSIAMTNAAMRVNTRTQYEVVVLAKMVSGTGQLFIDIAEYDTDTLPTGKRGIMHNGGGTNEAELVAGTRNFTLSAPSLSTSYAVYAATYIPTITAKWFSVNLYVGSDSNDQLFEWCIVRSTSTIGAPPLQNILPQNLGDFERIVLSDVTALSGTTLLLDAAQKYIGARSMKMTWSTSNGATGGVALSPTISGVVQFNLFHKANRRWLCVVAIRSNDSNVTGCVLRAGLVQGGGLVASANSYTMQAGDIGNWIVKAFVIDTTGLGYTNSYLQVYLANNAGKGGAPIAWTDAVQLLDVTDSPWLNDTVFPSEYNPSVGSTDQVYAGYRSKLGDTARATTSLSDDPDIAGWQLEAATLYEIEGLFIYDAGATPDIKWQFNFSQTPQRAVAMAFNHDGNFGSFFWTMTGTQVGEGSAQTGLLWFKGSILTHASNPGTLALQWAANGSGTATMRNGSYVNLTKIR